MAKDFSVTDFKRKRKLLQQAGKWVFFGGVVWSLIDCFTSFPTPARGPFALAVGGPLMILGAILYIKGVSLPLKEMTQMASYQKKEVWTVVDLVNEWDLSHATAEKILDAMVQRGYAEFLPDESRRNEMKTYKVFISRETRR